MVTGISVKYIASRRWGQGSLKNLSCWSLPQAYPGLIRYLDVMPSPPPVSQSALPCHRGVLAPETSFHSKRHCCWSSLPLLALWREMLRGWACARQWYLKRFKVVGTKTCGKMLKVCIKQTLPAKAFAELSVCP